LTVHLGTSGSGHGRVRRHRNDTGRGIIGAAILFGGPPAADHAAVVIEDLFHLFHPGLKLGHTEIGMVVLVVTVVVAGDGK
jgi:hypothetical protein